MKTGTKSLLFGLHQAVIHPLLVYAAFVKLHRRLPDICETLSIIVHDWGYWGKAGIDSDGGEDHPYLGASIMRALFGRRGWETVIGHNDYVLGKEGVPRSPLYAADKYYYVLIPTWLHSLLGRLSGEYREIEADPARGWDPQAFKQWMRTRFERGEIPV